MRHGVILGRFADTGHAHVRVIYYDRSVGKWTPGGNASVEVPDSLSRGDFVEFTANPERTHFVGRQVGPVEVYNGITLKPLSIGEL